MSDIQPSNPQGRGPEVARNLDMLLVTYALFAVGFIIVFTTIAAVVLAYMNRGDVAGTWRESHYTWLIRTFWIGLVAGLVATVTLIVGVGFLLMIAIAVWAIIRLVKGWMAYSKEQPITDPENWLFG